MRILIAANNDGGLYKFRKELIENLVNEHEVFISLPDGPYVTKLTEMGCMFEKFEFDRHGTNPIHEIQLISNYSKLLRKVRPDIVFTYTIKPNIYCGLACAKLGIPYVSNITGLGSAVENKGVLQIITTFLYRLGLRKAQKVFFQNTENQEFMVSRGIVNGSYDLLPGSGVNLNHFQLLEYPKADTIDFIFVARIMKEKGIDQYLDAAKYIRTHYPDTRFHVCGACEESYEETLRKLQEDGVIIYHGLVDDMREIQKISACTIHPSYYPEGLSNVLLESAASGRPIITTDRAGCREAVRDGENGYVVKQRDSADLISRIEQFLSLSWEERRDMGRNGRELVEKSFDRRIVIEKYLSEVKKAGTNAKTNQ